MKPAGSWNFYSTLSCKSLSLTHSRVSLNVKIFRIFTHTWFIDAFSCHHHVMTIHFFILYDTISHISWLYWKFFHSLLFSLSLSFHRIERIISTIQISDWALAGDKSTPNNLKKNVNTGNWEQRQSHRSHCTLLRGEWRSVTLFDFIDGKFTIFHFHF